LGHIGGSRVRNNPAKSNNNLTQIKQPEQKINSSLSQILEDIEPKGQYKEEVRSINEIVNREVNELAQIPRQNNNTQISRQQTRKDKPQIMDDPIYTQPPLPPRPQKAPNANKNERLMQTKNKVEYEADMEGDRFDPHYRAQQLDELSQNPPSEQFYPIDDEYRGVRNQQIYQPEYSGYGRRPQKPTGE